MFLKKFIFVNWGNIPNTEFDMGPVNLLSGGSGSGKTTVGDAIQTIMTAAHENLFQYNPGQDETTQRGRGGKRVRTLASYVLGCDDGSYARPSHDNTDGYLAAIFHPTKGETAEPFTAIIGIRAWLDKTAKQLVARQDELMFLILPGIGIKEDEKAKGFGIDHLIREAKGQYIVPLDKLTNLLIAEFGKSHVEKYDSKKRAYLRRLYGILQGSSDSVSEQEAMNAAKAFSRFMAYKPVDSIHRFVSEEILEKKDLGEAIRSISGQLKTIHAMERDAGQLVNSIEILQKAENYAVAYIDKWIELTTLEYTSATHSHVEQQKYYTKEKQKKRQFKTELQENEAATLNSQQYLEQAHERLLQLEAQRQGISALQQKDTLEQQLKQHHLNLTDKAKSLLQQDYDLVQNLNQIVSLRDELQTQQMQQLIPQFSDMESLKLLSAVTKYGSKGDVDINALLQKDLTSDLSLIEQHSEHVHHAQELHNQCYRYWYDSTEGQCRFEQLTGESHTAKNRTIRLKKMHDQKQKEIERLEHKKVNYPSFVQRAIDAIKQSYPQADPRVLCDHVEVVDERWQMAIEGYMGGARFSIIVDADYEAQAIRVIRELPGRDNRARIIQGEKAQRDCDKLHKHNNSIVQILEFSHATALHYITASYGSVLMVESEQELKSTGRGLTSDGMAAGSYSMWRCDVSDGDLVFGANARERALKAKQLELERISDDWQQADEQMKQLARLQDNVRLLKKLNYAEILSSAIVILRDIQKVEHLLDQLDLSKHKELENKLTELKTEERRLQQEYTILVETKGALIVNIENVTKSCTKLAILQDETQTKVEQCEENLRAIASDWPEFDVDKRLLYAESEASDLNKQVFENNYNEIQSQLKKLEKDIAKSIQQHNEQCMPSDTLLYDNYSVELDNTLFKLVCNTYKQLDLIYNRLKNNILVEKYQQLHQLKASFNNAFVTHLCHTIHQAVSSGKRQIALLNKELKNHKFGADQESFRFFSKPIPEYKEYATFFDEVIRQPTDADDVDLFDVPLEDKSIKVRDKLLSMLLDEDENKALKELERISDYRNYRRYEIYKDVEGKESIALSEYGTGSGGQLETPAYIIRAAAITSALRFNEGSNHLRMVLVDEAFSKMDESRSREVIDYLTKSLGLQLIFIMPSSKSGPFMDLISNEFVFAKCPSDVARGQLQTQVWVDRKICNTDKIKALWANHRRVKQEQAEMDFMQEFQDA
ncbi:FIG00979822: hypothetical protein [hydrothermal vent metagenome]|uniref:Chromosome partition protein smc n=1 Tax=hydrothermal vent metagenome TaxID=652676 RepID=A0A3B1AT08_9ZZZZ